MGETMLLSAGTTLRAWPIGSGSGFPIRSGGFDSRGPLHHCDRSSVGSEQPASTRHVGGSSPSGRARMQEIMKETPE